MNKKGHYGLIELDATNLPKWILYPLIFLIMSVMLVVVVFFIFFLIHLIKGDVNFMPFFGYGFHMPIGVMTTSSQTCFQNGVQIDCNNFTGDEHFCNNGICEMNGICNKSIEECLK